MGWTDLFWSEDGGVLGTGVGGKGGALGTGILGTGRDDPSSTAVAQELTKQSNENAQKLYEEALAAAAGAKDITGPAAVTPGSVYVPGIEASDPRFTAQATQAKAFDATSGMKGYDAALAEAADATAAMRKAGVTDMRDVNPAYVSAVNTNVTAPQIGEAAQTGAVNVDRVAMDPLANQLRDEQIKAAQGIATAPSAAMSQFKAGESQVMSDALAAAAAARGSERAGARRDAMLRIASGGAQQNLAAAALSAQEEQQKRTAAATALSSIRSQDVTSSQAQANIQAQQANLQAQIDQAIATGNTEAVNTLKQQQAQLQLAAQQSSVQAGLSQQSTQAGLEQANLQARLQTAQTNATAANQAEQAYAQALNTAGQQTAQNKTNVSVQNAGAQTTAAKDYAQAANTAYQQFAQNQTQVNTTNAAAQTAANEANANRQTDLAKTNMQGSLAQQTTNAGNTLEASKATAGNQLQTEQLRQQTLNSGLQTGIAATNTQAGNAQATIGAAQADQDVKQKQQAGVLGALGGIISAVKSDERVKEDIEPVGGRSYDEAFRDYDPGNKETAKEAAARLSPQQIDDWAAHLQPITYRYRPGTEDGGAEPHLGLSANEVERSGPLGQLMVSRDESGVRRLDYGAAALMLGKAAFQKASAALEAAQGRRAR